MTTGLPSTPRAALPQRSIPGPPIPDRPVPEASVPEQAVPEQAGARRPTPNDPPADGAAGEDTHSDPNYGPDPGPHFAPGFRAALTELFRWRRDVRHFRPDPVPDALIEELLDLAALAPSVGLSQPWRFVRVDDPGRRAAVCADFARANAEALAAQSPDRAARYAGLKLSGLEQAPCHLAAFVDPDPEQGNGLGRATMPETAAYSAVMAVHTLWLAARAAGLGLGWVSILDPAAVTRVLDVPPGWRLIGYLCLGYPEAPDDVPELERRGWESRRPARAAILRR